MKLSWGSHTLDFSRKTAVMGILNVTPDSFSDGGLHFGRDAALERGLRMIDDGADIIDVGGESSRPGSEPVTLEEELGRTIPVIEALTKKTSLPISIDTTKAEVASRAIEAGASMINDISGMRFDPEMPVVASRTKVPVVIMHIKGKPKDMQEAPQYQDIVSEITDYFRIGIRLAKKFGIREDMIILDPGIGFGKTFDHNLEVLNNLERFSVFGRPLMIGPSRKAFLGGVLGGAPPGERLEGTVAAVAAAVMKGAQIVRVHDVREVAKAVRVLDAIRRESVSP